MIILPHECNFVAKGDQTPDQARCVICGKSIMDGIVYPEPDVEKSLEFMKYRSIHELEDEIINAIIAHGYDQKEWVVLNKYHGANFSVQVSPEEIRFATRNGFFSKEDDPYGFYKLPGRERYLQKVSRDVHGYYGKNVVLWFEYFGGSYPHPEVKKTAMPRIQKGVFYCPWHDIRLIDIAVDGRIISYDEMVKVAVHHEIRTARELYRGRFKDCINFNPVFEDPTYLDYNLPKIENNFSEGVVIKTIEPLFFKNKKRCILKNKNPKFKEKQREPRAIRPVVPLSEETQQVLDNLSMCITENRLNNILSHGEQVNTFEDFPRIVGLFVQDILKEESGVVKNVEKTELSRVKKLLSKEIAGFIRPTLINMIKKKEWI